MKQLMIFLLCFLPAKNALGQISPELQHAIESVPFAKFDYPANRDRNKPPQVASPQAFAFAYYQLPYAINLDLKKDPALNTYVEIVLIDFSSVALSADKEKEVLKKAITGLRGLLNNQYYRAQLYGYYANTSYSNSMLSQIAREGDAIIAIREILSTKSLLNTLTERWKSVSE